MENTRHHYHSFFWPTILIGVGVIWLLVNFGIIAPVSIGMIWQFWPLLLIMLGLDILFSRHYAWVGSLVGILAVGGLVAYLIMQPHTGLQTTGQILNETFTAPLGETTAVTYNLETASEPVHLYALNNDSSQLIDANLTHQGTIGFSATGTTNVTIGSGYFRTGDGQLSLLNGDGRSTPIAGSVASFSTGYSHLLYQTTDGALWGTGSAYRGIIVAVTKPCVVPSANVPEKTFVFAQPDLFVPWSVGPQ